MVRISPSALALLETARELKIGPESRSVRIAPHRTDAGEDVLRVGWAEEPQPSDEVVDTGEVMSLFVTEQVASQLEDAVIDVSQDPSKPIVRFTPQDCET